MKLINHLQQASLNLMTSKLRSSLAMLGILVGTAAIVALISCGKLATQKALAEFKSMGTDLLAVSTYQQTENRAQAGKSHISIRLWREMPFLIPGIIDSAPYSTAYQSITFEGISLKGPIIGADEALARIIKIKIKQGHFLSSYQSFEHVCVIGSKLAKELQSRSFGPPVGKQIQIGSVLYTIIGVTAPWKENAFFNEDINQAVLIPLRGMALVSPNSAINQAVLLLRPDAPIDPVIEHIKQLITTQAPKLSVFSRSAKQIIMSMERQGHIFTLLLTTIGAISLVVGGIGIMNVMLVSVSERKQEIGIRKAVGATNRNIQYLFLMEAALLSCIGGLLGILVGLGITVIVAYFNQWSFALFLSPILAGFGVSVATGLFFGFYPARRAAKLDTVVSLRGIL